MKAGKLFCLLISIVATLCLGSCIFSSDKDDQVHGPITVNIHNFTGHTANGIYIKGTTGTDWGTNYLAGTLVNGAISSDITIPSQLSTSGRFDFLLRTTNDRVFLQSGMAVPPGSQAVTVPFQSAHLFANTESFTVSNQVGFPIVDLRIQPVDSEHWGDNKIQGSLNNGDGLPVTLDIPLGVVNRYNIRLVRANGTSYTRLNQLINQGDAVIFNQNHIDGAVTLVRIQNTTGQNFSFARLKPTVGSQWSNVLSGSFVHGSTITTEIETGFVMANGQYDIQLMTQSTGGTTATIIGMTLTQDQLVTFTSAHLDVAEAVTSIRIQNFTGQNFSFARLKPTVGSQWSNAQAGSFVYNSTVTLGIDAGFVTPGTQYDIQLMTQATGGSTATITGQFLTQNQIVTLNPAHLDTAENITMIQLQNTTGQNFNHWSWRTVGGNWSSPQSGTFSSGSTVTVTGNWSPTAHIELRLQTNASNPVGLSAIVPALVLTQNVIVNFTPSHIVNNVTQIRLRNSTDHDFYFWVWRTTGGTWSTPQSGNFWAYVSHAHSVSGAWNSATLYDVQFRTTQSGGITATRLAVNFSQDGEISFTNAHVDDGSSSNVTAIQIQNNTGQNFGFVAWRPVGGSWNTAQSGNFTNGSSIAISGTWAPAIQYDIQLRSTAIGGTTATRTAQTFTQNGPVTFTVADIDGGGNVTAIQVQNTTGQAFNFVAWRPVGGSWNTAQSGNFSNGSTITLNGTWLPTTQYDIQLRTTAAGGTTATRTGHTFSQNGVVTFTSANIDGGGGLPQVTLVNNTSLFFVEINIFHADSDENGWSITLPSTFSPGASLTFTLPNQSPNSMWDFEARTHTNAWYDLWDVVITQDISINMSSFVLWQAATGRAPSDRVDRRSSKLDGNGRLKSGRLETRPLTPRPLRVH
jgi:hypothetical protein